MVVSNLTKFARSTKHFVIAICYFIKGILEYFVPACLYAKDVSKDVVLITGAGSGLGRSIALEYAKLGSSLILWDISQTGIEQTKQMVEKVRNSDKNEAQKNKFCLIYVVDISDRDKVRAYGELVARDLENLRQYQQDELYVSVLVNNAGIYHGRLLEELTEEQIERMFKINILSHFWTVRAFLPAMKRHRKGHIVEVASMAGWAGLYKQVDYCSAKFANGKWRVDVNFRGSIYSHEQLLIDCLNAVGFEEALNMELDYLGYGDQIRTTCLCPSFINTPLFSGNQTK